MMKMTSQGLGNVKKMSYIKVNVAAVGPNHLCKAFAALHTAEFTTSFHHGLNTRACRQYTYLRNSDVIHQLTGYERHRIFGIFGGFCVFRTNSYT